MARVGPLLYSCADRERCYACHRRALAPFVKFFVNGVLTGRRGESYIASIDGDGHTLLPATLLSSFSGFQPPGYPAGQRMFRRCFVCPDLSSAV